jgi:hypothetical protein
MKAHMVRIPFRLYITVEDVVIEVVLAQVMEGKEHIITYLSQCLIDVGSMLALNYDITCYLVLM